MLQTMLAPGLDIRLARSLDLSAIINIEKLRDGRMQLTVVPLLYGSYTLKRGTGGFTLEPPTDLNLAAGVPVIKSTPLQEALRVYAEYRREQRPGESALRMPAPPTAQASATPGMPELVRVEEAPTPAPVVARASTPAPAPVVAQATPRPTPAPVATPTPALIAANRPQATPAPEPPPPPPAPVASAIPVSPTGVPLKPFISSAPVPNVATAGGGAWKTYAPGQMPRGRLLNLSDAARLAESGGIGNDPVYLQGNFVVTAAGENRAVLRTPRALAGGGSGAARVFVEYPAGFLAPDEGADIARDEQRPFQITDVRRGADGTVNVYVREVTAP